ncbi:MAG: FAD-dependent oxidoreductase [Actinomadura sp.]
MTRSAAWELNTRTNQEIVKGCLESLRTHYPETRDAQVVHAHVVRQPRATFSLRPGTAGARRPQRTPIGGLVLAGDWTRTDFTSTMGGATQSAARAVEALRGYDPTAR